MVMQDYYETLQVHPKADLETIKAAYERLHQRYDPALLANAADELVELARTRRDALERAYLILSDPDRRAAHDAELAGRAAADALAAQARLEDAAEAPLDPRADELIDYRPLPPARRQPRPKDFTAQPYLRPTQVRRRAGRQAGAQPLPALTVPALLVGAFTFVVMLVSLFNTVTNRPTPTEGQNASAAQIIGQATPVPATMTPEQFVEQFEGQVVEARRVAQQAPENPNAWVELGNALYDSVQVARERMPNSPTYIERLPRWLEAAEAYRKALAIAPNNPTVQSDLAGSLCYYGVSVNDTAYLAEGLAEARKAVAMDEQDARVLLNLGVCLINQVPPQTQEALSQWQRLINLPDTDPRLIFQARQLIAQYGS
jgi:cytochrome c-type biogenesis protein CcmH/NrfG